MALLGAFTGLAIHVLTLRHEIPPASEEVAQIKLALATFLGIGAILLGFLVERTRPTWTLSFAAVAGFVVALATYWNGPFNWYGSADIWQPACALLSVIIAAPLFQSWRGYRDQANSRLDIPYVQAYHYAWTNVVLWCAAWVFVCIAWLMALLLGELFRLIGIRLLHDLLQEHWVILMLIGAALGAGIGLLRDREQILGLLQRVVTTVLAVLAPVLALGLIVFLAAIPVTGLAPLWEATKSTTPILLGCIIGALCLTNAVIGETDMQTPRSPVLRFSAQALCLAVLPLAVIAAISTGSRIHQYGLTPDRLWAVMFTGIACAYGLASLVAVIRGRLAPAAYLRTANLHLAVALCALAFLLSTPLVSFGALSTRDQVTRLRNGTTPADKFDWRALRFEFGSAGVEAVRDLARTGATPAIRAAAAEATKAKSRWEVSDLRLESPKPVIDQQRLTILPRKIALPDTLLARLPDYNACGLEDPCAVVYKAGSDEAVVLQGTRVNIWRREGNVWSNEPGDKTFPGTERVKQINAGIASGKVELRDVTRRQMFVDGKPVGDPFE
ncbi:DUF4153 domain-containing protein [Novosphingobium barchaimii]|uniref:DUF4153 domain-containing protein n=1 Tax=Novosphingobium barchaimii TaxID=1420591 RepID=UPI000741159E|nr:DUF4153 domain-containing protein [Novosphingobium barchaimii]